MSTTPTTPTTTDEQLTLHEMSEAQSREALAAHAFGRLALTLDDGPTILPINYAYVGSSIVIRTAPGSKLRFAPMTAVAFEIDDIAGTRSWGWSVVARGMAFDISDAIDEHSEMLRALPFNPWLAGDKHNVIMIKVHTVTGRWFGDANEVAKTAAGR